MTLKEKINTDFMIAFKSKNMISKNILSVIKGEIQTIEKNIGSDNLSDDEVTKILTKTVKSLKETITLGNDEKSKLEFVDSLLNTSSLLTNKTLRVDINSTITSSE